LEIGEWFSGQKLDGSSLGFFRKRPHGDGWNQEPKHHWRNVEQLVEGGIMVVQQTGVREHEHDHAQDGQEQKNDEIANLRNEKRIDFLSKNRKHLKEL
jgi:hypothetical protein